MLVRYVCTSRDKGDTLSEGWRYPEQLLSTRTAFIDALTGAKRVDRDEQSGYYR